jgi:hypothetical protein
VSKDISGLQHTTSHDSGLKSKQSACPRQRKEGIYIPDDLRNVVGADHIDIHGIEAGSQLYVARIAFSKINRNLGVIVDIDGGDIFMFRIGVYFHIERVGVISNGLPITTREIVKAW